MKLSENQLHEEANEIFCAEDAVDNENENSFIDNVWDDFDDHPNCGTIWMIILLPGWIKLILVIGHRETHYRRARLKTDEREAQIWINEKYGKP